MADQPADTRQQIADFVGCLFEPNDLVEIRNCAPKGQCIDGQRVGMNQWVRAAQLPDLSDDLLRENAKWNIYVGVNPRRARGVRGVRQKDCSRDRPCGRCANCVAHAKLLFVDLEKIEPDKALQVWSGLGLPSPTLVISSGHGVHIYLRLGHPIDISVFRRFQRGLIQLFIGEGIDPSIHDPPRIMRLPGFVNHNPPAGVRAEIIESDSALTYELADIANLNPATEGDSSSTDAPAATVTEIPEDLRQRIVSQLEQESPDRSKRDFCVCIDLQKAGIAKATAEQLVCNFSKFSERAGTGYFERTWAAAMKYAGSATDDEVDTAQDAPAGAGHSKVAALRITFGDAAADLCNRIESNEPIVETLPTGLSLLDDTTGGLPRGEAAGIVGPPGLGKTTVADQIGLGVLLKNPASRVCIVNLETPTRVRIARLIAGQTVQLGPNNGIARSAPVSAILHGCLEERGKEIAIGTARHLTKQIGERLVFFEDAYDANEIVRIIEAERPDLLIVDHLGLVQAPVASADSVVERQDNALNALVRAMRKTNTAGLILNEVTKSALVTKDYDLSSSRGSARFASIVSQYMTLHRDPDDISEDPRIILTLHKNRFGIDHRQQAARFMGGLAYLSWGAIEPIPPRPVRGKKESVDDK